MLFFIAIIIIIACENGYSNNPSQKVTCVDFPEPPIEIMSNKDSNSSDYDCELINYFNIIQIQKDLYYMYYAAYGVNSGTADIDQGLFFAYSNDAIHWKRELSNGGSNLLLENGIQEQSAFILNSDKEYPFRLIANIKEDGKFKLCMWKSRNGFDFDFSNKIVLLDDILHDTQNVIIPKNKELYLFMRLWSEDGKDRRNGVATFDLDGKLVSPLDTIERHYVYNSAASHVNDAYDLLQPTYMNNKDGDNKSDDAFFKAYLYSIKGCNEIETNLNKWLGKDEKWRIVAPGVIDIKGKKYISYYTWNWSHDSKQPVNGISR